MCVGMRTKNIQHSLGSCLNKNSSCSRHLLCSGTKCFVCFTRLILTSALCGECSHYPHFTANRSTQLEAVQLELEAKQPGTRVWGLNDCCLRHTCLHQQDPIPRFPLCFLQSTSTSHILYIWALLIIPWTFHVLSHHCASVHAIGSVQNPFLLFPTQKTPIRPSKPSSMSSFQWSMSHSHSG